MLRNDIALLAPFRYVTAMAPLSNAERQARYRARLKAAAAGADLIVQARETMLAAVHASWAIGKREDWADFEEFETIEDWLAYIRDLNARKDENAAKYLREFFTEYLADADEAQREVLERAISLLHAVTLR